MARIHAARYVYYRMYIPVLLMYANFNDKKEIKKNGFEYVPPVSLRYRVSGNMNLKEFMDAGKHTAHDIENALKKINRDLDSFENILDFGCGCGRTLLWLANRKPKIYGTDIDADAINWATKNLGFGTFANNRSLPPLEYANNTFDFIYAISVFTHLNEEHQFQWLEELKRILKTSGILILTVHGEGSWRDSITFNVLPQEQLTRLQKTGFIYVNSEMSGIFPHWYQLSYHTKWYVLDKFGKYFKVLDYTEKGLNNHQDLVVLQKI